ncbi:MAG: acyl-phosphate glycerol 3-phosphate acyltransferase [Methylophilales bacterium BACL14 MAG-120910-bin43]|jgi:acyl phosphate:glycerol-3-phosphate acyltransferase|nr:MAG: acyl-phosphate glycerol 3-phosphate acyltransferase [Methylophilales bacterium BACL14 MAG-120910-bin43]KRP07459.1 MAG: acyl-phosphate glycerol 3-phosphate acyltransferase [Methylophilales bacterium BACL14 MAG-120920-bin58]|tara:strand:+ start:1363 stop:1950 length:588 start_codon:yes stop_codon:yes gene_type:complete
MINQILFVAIAYFIGSLSFGILASKIFSISDPRTMGSKNPGATNVLRTGNKYAAIFTLLGDMLKATLVVMVALSYEISGLPLIALSLAVLLGHIFPIYHGFKGGKGVATALGILLAINWVLALSVLFVWLLFFLIFRYSSLSAIISSLAAPFIAYFLNQGQTIVIIASLVALLIVYRHQSNINNLLHGKEASFKK